MHPAPQRRASAGRLTEHVRAAWQTPPMERTPLAVPAVYCWPQSGLPGEAIGVHASGPGVPAQVIVARIGAKRERVWTAEITLTPHDIPTDAAAHGCGWPAAVEIPIGEDWRSGYYEVTLRTDAGRIAHEAVAFFVVRAAVVDPSRPLLALCTNTYNAYNDIGGRNLYEGGTQVSFQRPMANGLLRKPAGPGERVTVLHPPDPFNRDHVKYLVTHQFTQWGGSAGWPNYELPFIQWAERNGYEIDYALNADLEDPTMLDGRRLYLSVGHDEYWSGPMRDTVEAFTQAGGNAMFLSGNTSLWQVRIEDGGATMVGFKDRFERDPVFGTAREAELTSFWSDHLVDRPENHMTGVSFVRGGYHRIGRTVASGAGGYTVYRPDHWVFDGTDTTYGDLIGRDSVIVGYECDGCDFTMRDGLPTPTGSDGTPADFQILALTPTEHFNRTNAPRPPPDGVMSEVEYIAWRVFGERGPDGVAAIEHGHCMMGVHEPGGFVFTAGTTDWVWGLTGDDPTVERITRNLIDRGIAP